MRQSNFLMTVVLMAAMAWGGQDEPALTVHVYNNAGLPERQVPQALDEAGRILAMAGIGVTWVRCASDGRPGTADSCQESGDPRLLVFSINADAPAGMHDVAMGFALPFSARGNHAAAFTVKVARFAVNHMSATAPETSVLGAVIAHEIGHLLLRSNQHGDGIMRADWQGEAAKAISQRRLQFTPAQAQAMRQGLQKRVQAFQQKTQDLERASTR